MQTPAADPLSTLLDGLPALRREVFEERLARWLPDLREALQPLYVDHEDVLERLVQVAAAAFASRDDDLHRLDLKRSLEPDWFQRPGMVGYAAYADRFAGTLSGVADKASYLTDLGVGYLHLMPLLTPRPAPNDGGYAVQDFRSVRPDLGTVADLRALTKRLRGDGISLCLDLVLNHVAREHEWAVRARAGEATYRDYFLVFPDRSMPDAYEQTLPEVFPDFAPGNFTWDAELDGWVWTTFNDYQWDVSWANPDVLCEYAGVILDLANHGVEVFRLDAIAFTWKRIGTSCQNQPEVHALTQALRVVARIACPAVVFKAEAIVGPQDLVAYLGPGHAPRQGQRPRLPQRADGADLVDARLAGRPARRTGAPVRCRRPRRRPRGSPTRAATTTSAGRSPTRTPRRWGCPASSTGSSSPTGTPASSPGRGPAGWCSRRTRRPATAASPGRSPRWPGSRPGDPVVGRPDPAGARAGARLRRAAGDLDG